MVRMPGLEPGWGIPNGFSCHFGFRRRLRVRGLDYPFTLAFQP